MDHDMVSYDVETSDADQRHAQVTQFGAVRADASFGVLEELDLKVRRLPWVVPAPKALEVTRMRASDLDAPGRVSEYEAAGRINSFLQPDWSGPKRIMLTYNGVKFDDEVIRSTLFRNLRSPWFSSGKNVIRVDLLPLVRLVMAVAPGAVAMGRNALGEPSLRLEHLAPANGIGIDAHDALGDARAVLDLARIVRERAPVAWNAALAAGRTADVDAKLSAAAQRGSPVYLFTHFREADLAPCAVLATDGKRRYVLADLRKEGAREAAAIAESMYAAGTPYPVVRSAATPYLLDAADAALIAPDMDFSAMAAKAMAVRMDRDLCAEAHRALLSGTFAEQAGRTAEERIYDGFPGDADKKEMTAFHRKWKEGTVPDFERFSDGRLREFAARVTVDAAMAGDVAVDPALLSRAMNECLSVRSRPWAGDDARWMTLGRAAAEAGADWKEWAAEAFAEGPPVPVEETAPEGPAQMEMF